MLYQNSQYSESLKLTCNIIHTKSGRKHRCNISQHHFTQTKIFYMSKTFDNSGPQRIHKMSSEVSLVLAYAECARTPVTRFHGNWRLDGSVKSNERSNVLEGREPGRSSPRPDHVLVVLEVTLEQ